MTEKKDQAPAPVDLDDIAGWIQADRDLTAQINQAEAQIAALRAQLQLDELAQARGKVREQIQERLGDAHEGRVGGVPVVRWKPHKAGLYFDEKRFKIERAELYAQYRKPKKATRPYVLLDLPDGVR